MVTSLRQHQSALSCFNPFSSDRMLSSTIGSQLKSVAFLCMKQLSFVEGVERRICDATPEKEPSPRVYGKSQHPYHHGMSAE